MLANASGNQGSTPHLSPLSPPRFNRSRFHRHWHDGSLSLKVANAKERVHAGTYQPSVLRYKNNQWQCPFHPAGLPCPATRHPLVIPMWAGYPRPVLLLSLATATCASILVSSEPTVRSPATSVHFNMDLRAWLTLVSFLCLFNFNRITPVHRERRPLTRIF